MAKGLKTGGRRAGTPNKDTDLLLMKCHEKGLDVFGAMIELAQGDDIPAKLTMLKELAQYLYPKRKALEVTITDLTDDEVLAEAEKRLTKKPE